MKHLTPSQRTLLANLAMDARARGIGWATAVARASEALQEAGARGDRAFDAACQVHRGLNPRWAR